MSTTTIIYACLFLVELAVSVAISLTSYCLLKLILPYDDASVATAVSTVSTLWFVHVTLRAFQILQNGVRGNECCEGNDLNTIVKEFKSKICKNNSSCSCGSKQSDEDFTKPSKVISESKNLIRQSTEGYNSTKISMKILAIFATVIFQCAVRLFALLHSINRTFGLKRRSPANTSPLISFFDIPFTIGKSMSLGGRSFLIFYFLDKWLDQSGGVSNSDSTMLQAVSFDKISIDLAHIMMQKGIHVASTSRKSPWLGVSLGDIQFALTIHLKQNHKSVKTKSDTITGQNLRSISITIRIKSLEFGLFPSINRVRACGIQFDAKATFDYAGSAAILRGVGVALECNQLSNLDNGLAKIISWDTVHSTFYIRDSVDIMQVASLVKFPAGSVIQMFGNKSPVPRQASVILGTSSQREDKEISCQSCFSLGFNFEAMPKFLIAMNWLLRDVLSSAFVNSASSSEETQHRCTTKLKKSSSIEIVELDAACCLCFYATSNIDDEESFYLTSTNATLYWRKIVQLNPDDLIRSDYLGPTYQFQDHEHSRLSPMYIARLADVNLVGFHRTLLNIIRLDRMRTKLIHLPAKKRQHSTSEVTNDPRSIRKHAVADMGHLVVRLDDDMVKRVAQLNKAVKATINSANHLKDTTNQLKALFSKKGKSQSASSAKKSNPQHVFDVMKLSSECVDAVIELQPSFDDNNTETSPDDGCIRIAVLQGKSVGQLSYKDTTKETLDNNHGPGNKLPPPDALFEYEMQQFGGFLVTEAEISRLEFSVTFYPHSSLPVIRERMMEKSETTFYGQLNDLLLKLASPPKAQMVSTTVKRLCAFELLGNQTTGSLLSIPVYDCPVCDSINTGQNDWPMLQGYSRDHSYALCKILTGAGKFCRIEKKDTTLDEKAELVSIQISRGSPDLQVCWSPVFQWLQASLNERIQHAIVYVKSSLSSSSSDQCYKCCKTQIRVLVDSNTNATLHTSLGQMTVMHTVIEGGMDMNFSMSKYQTSHTSTKTGLKPNISFEAGRILVAFNDITNPTFVLGSLFLDNFTRPATLDEISDYVEKKGVLFHDFEKELVTNHEGHPMKEIFYLKLATCTAKFHPSLHFGEVTDDFLLTPRSLDVGLDSLKQNVIKREKKYQLMSIKVSFSFLDVSLLDDASCYSYNEISPATMNGMLLQDVFRAYFESIDVAIERDTPPEVIQSTIAALDEDKTLAYTYGPTIQGGRLRLTMDHAVATLVPLNLAIPLLCINGFDMIGPLFLSGLSPDTPGIGEGRTNDSLLLCHHGLSPSSHSCGSRACGCYYGIQTHSSGIPVKVYIDSKLKFRELDVSYGPVMNLSIPRLMECIQRLLPPAPQNTDKETAKSLPLTWWDNIRFFIHGKVALSARALSVRWLLDSQYHLDQSILLTFRRCEINYSLGFFGIDATELTVSIPGTPYNMSVHPSKKSAPKPPHYLPYEAECAVEERHPIIFVPLLSTKITFSWKMLVDTSHTSSDHHSPYVGSQSIKEDSVSRDKFEPFRSDGVSANFEFDLPGSELVGNWVVLRIDVLPWFTHVNAVATTDTSRPSEDHQSESLPKFQSVALKVRVDELKLAAWYAGEKELDDWDTDDVEGVCLSVKSLSYISSGCDKDLVIEGPIKGAANLNVNEFIDSLECHEKEDNDMREIERMGQTFGRDGDIDSSCSEESSISDEDDEIPPFFKLQVLSRSINELDYVVNAGQIDIQNRSLQSILAGSTRDTDDGSGYLAGVDDTTWSILVSQLKILWTLEIRDNLMALTQDLSFTIGFMKSQIRQSQLLAEHDDSSSPVDNNQSVSLHEATDEGVEMIISKKVNETEGESRLEYLLQREVGVDLGISTNGYQENVIAAQSAHSEQSGEGTENPTIPTIDIHFSNPQVQLHRKATGGSIILAMEGAHIEGRKFVRFLVDNHRRNGKVTPSDLTRRTEHAYTLTNLQAYSLSTRVDVTAGLPWLTVCVPGSQSAYTGGESYLEERFGITGQGQNHDASGSCSQVPEESDNDTHQYIYPPHLRHHEPLAFLKTGLLSPILNQFTFKSRQTFHRPPIHYSSDELLDFINQGLVATQDDDVVDEVDLKIDLLHFTLDSYQFKTTFDIIRNVLLEPPKPRRHRNFGGEETEPQTSSDRISSVAAMEMEEILASDVQRGKHGREKLRSAAMNLLRDLEDRHALGGVSITRRISYRLKKLIWCITSPSSIDTVDIDFTGFLGLHDYFSDGSVSSQFGLEDVRVSSSRPGPDSIIFPDPTSVIKPVLDERSPCQRCHRRFDHSQNNLNSCSFHAGKFLSGVWSCCNSTDSLGCKSGPHTGKERAAIVRVETLPRIIEGITLYSHFEVNIFPETPHALIVQISKSLSKLFMSYFFVGGAEEKESLFQPDDAVSTITDGTGSTEAFSTKTENAPRQKAVLFGGKGSPREKQAESSYTPEPSTEVCSRPEIVFIKVWRVGYINVEVTTGGFRRIPQRTIDICVPAYSRAYKIGSWAYLGQKYLMYLVHEVLKSGASSAIFRRKGPGGASDVQSDPAQSLNKPTVESVGLPSNETFIGRLRQPVGAEAILGTPIKPTKPSKMKVLSFVKK